MGEEQPEQTKAAAQHQAKCWGPVALKAAQPAAAQSGEALSVQTECLEPEQGLVLFQVVQLDYYPAPDKQQAAG